MSLLADLLHGLKDLEKCEDLKPKPQTEADKALMYTTRTETDGKLQVYEGSLPPDMNGVFYVIYPVGSVNSGGLPFPQTIDGQYNSEYASPLMNGDGMILSIAFDRDQLPAIKSRLIKPPCFFADYNTRDGVITKGSKTPGNGLGLFKFSNFGLSRMSLFLGARNLLNTAVIPVKFGNSDPFLLSTYDVGRPFIMDPLRLKLQSPLGSTSDWVPATPTFLRWPFPIVQTTAHPSFDPNTQELFSVNYCKSSTANEYFITQRTAYHLKNNNALFKEKLIHFCQSMMNESDSGKIAEALMDFFLNLDHHMTGEAKQPTPAVSPDETSVWLMRWKGAESIEKWTLIDPEGGDAIQIQECMHQTALTKDYIVLTQTAFKFSLDLLINNPFPNEPCIDIFIRQILADAMLPYTDCYIVKRSDLTPGGGKVIAHKITMPAASSLNSSMPTDNTHPLPVETIHYSCDYQNPDEKITLYGIHNSSSCVAEWIRPYDTAQLTGKQVNTNLMGMFALGSMDVNRIGKWVIDCKSFGIDAASSKQYVSPGRMSARDIAKRSDRNADCGPTTWTLGLYTFRDIVSPLRSVDRIKYMWYIANGTDPDYLTEFIYGLYKDCKDRILPVDDVLTYTQAGIPQSLVRLHCGSLQPDDYFQFAYGTYIRSIQFIPRPQRTTGVEYELDGYLFCTMQVPQDPVNYRSEYWVFDAAKISKGPVCKLFFDGIQFCFTLHSAWMESAKAYDLSYDVDVRTDYNQEITNIFSSDPSMKDTMLSFFEKYVYTDWYRYKNE